MIRRRLSTLGWNHFQMTLAKSWSGRLAFFRGISVGSFGIDVAVRCSVTHLRLARVTEGEQAVRR